jgi:hypothetical protein
LGSTCYTGETITTALQQEDRMIIVPNLFVAKPGQASKLAAQFTTAAAAAAKIPMSIRVLSTIALVVLAIGACSHDNDSSQAGAKAKEAPPPNANVAAADMGGAVEELTGNYGPGFTGRRLIDGLADPTWKWFADGRDVPYPQEAIISFYERQPALIKALTFVLPANASSAPRDVEIWTAMDTATARFAKSAAATLEAKPGEQTVSFPPVEARFVKLRVLSGAVKDDLEIAEVRVIEAARNGYTPLFVRAPRVTLWKGSPREAAQRGLDWLQQAAPEWAAKSGCFGCHVQSQVLMGQAVALQQGYRINVRSVQKLDSHVRSQNSWGSWWSPSQSASVFGAMGVAYAADILGIAGDSGLSGAHPYSKGVLLLSADRLVERQDTNGGFPLDLTEPPIVQGQFMTTANALVALQRAASHSGDPRYKQSAERGLAWIAAHEPQTTQDKIFKVIALMHYGTPDHKRSAWSVVETLTTEQESDGGWKENAAADGSNAIATGQVLYAFKQAGVSIHSPMFRRGVDYLLKNQVSQPVPDNGLWNPVHTESKRPSAFAHTMWAVIGLAGAYGVDPTGALQIVRQQGDKPPSPNLEIVLDVSGSMNTKLGESTRWRTALDVLKEVVGALPDDLNVGLRVYGHRYSSKSAETCRDSELLVPLVKLDRARVLKVASRLRPRGETPLIRSVLQTVGDLRAVGGGSVILITDGEESCKGDAKAAAAELQGSGLNVTLNIVGFTLTGEAVEAELGALAGSTGGRYYGAQDGEQLSRAVKLAALQRLPYDILDASGKVLVSGQTSELSRELPPGKYRIRIDALGQILEEPLTIVADQTTTLGLGVEGDRFVIRR